ncbi:MAG: excinuclease ABC subunit UvrC [Candidatus Omnitrophica bacterium]|nr:excinuclease ABC subunit UvrC [Candidatus Omnitrophota bacterium]
MPDQPGVYLFYDEGRQLLYVGKALSLRKRVASYFRAPRQLAPRMAQMVGKIRAIDVRTTASEAEALLLEAQLIKQQRPRFNVLFRDDKAYPLLKIANEPFPRLLVVRRRADDGGKYFGPYPDAGLMHEAVRFLRRVFPLRTCRTFPATPCLEYHLGQCLAPCVRYIDAARYQHIVEDLAAFLEGKRDRLLNDLSRRMQQASRDRRFEEAARLRDQIQALTSVIVAKAKSLSAGPLEQLQAALKLPRLPRRIEAFDISHVFGEAAVGSMVVFTDGKPHKAHYRRFKIATVDGIDDYRMMREVIRRRYSGTLSTALPSFDSRSGRHPERSRGMPLPDLILVDGGKGQLAAACEELAALRLSIPSMGLAKRFEHIFLPGASVPIVLLPTSPVLHLVQHIRDEAHRFAITYHRTLRRNQLKTRRTTGGR